MREPPFGAELHAPAGLVAGAVGSAFYAAWWTLGLLALPLALLHPQARRHVLGLVTPEPGMTWLHGASKGEHEAARVLAPELPEGAFRTSSSWRTPVPGAFPAPLDLPFVVGRWLDAGRPGRLILVESELWPGWLLACRLRGIPVCVVHARDSRGTRRWRALGPLWRWLVQGVVFIPQSTTGDLKLLGTSEAGGLRLGRPALIAASTRPGDEARLMAALAVWPDAPLLVLAPRHLERVSEVAELLDGHGLSWTRRSALQGDLVPAEVQVLLLDTMGELAGLMPQGRACFVGGTFDEALGGHSPAEAFRAGLPVVRGPVTHANPAAWQAGLSFPVSPTATAAQLQRVLAQAVTRGPGEPVKSEALGKTLVRLPPPLWPEERPARPWLQPLVPLVQAVGRRRPGWADEPVRVDVPVVSVGALVAGGAGKTPVVAWLAARLPGVWVVARGYRRDPVGPEVRVGLPGEPVEHDLGDELELLRRRGIPVVSAPDRVAGAQEAVRRGARVILLDDGFQHRRLHRDLDIVCIDARWPDGRGPIPVGTRREPWSGLSRAHVVWLHHAGPRVPLPPQLEHVDLPIVKSELRPTGWHQGGHHRPLPARRGPVDVVVGIARPAGFLGTLTRLGLEVQSFRALPDHGQLPELPDGVVMTEKDAARLPEEHDAWALCIGLAVSDVEPLLTRLRELGVEVRA